MDDKVLEERLKQLKKSYDRIPSVNSPQTIMEHIQKNENKRVQKTRFHFPYVASFVGVLLLGSILGMQFFRELPSKDQSDLSAQSQLYKEEEASLADTSEAAPFSEPDVKENSSYEVTDERYNEAVRDLSLIYNQLAEDMRNKLFMKEISQYSFVQEAEGKLNEFKAIAKRGAKSDQDFLRLWDEHRQFIIQKMMTLEMAYWELEREAQTKDIPTESDVEVRLESLIQKQSEFLPAYQERWRIVQTEIKSIDNMDALIKQLNDEQAVSSETIQQFKAMALSSGYKFYHEGEGIVGLQIDFQRTHETFEPYISPAFKHRLEMLSKKQIAVDGTLNLSFEQLGDHIAELEKAILEDPSSFGASMLYEQYKKAFRYYLSGTDNASLLNSQGVLKESVKKDYQRFVKEHAGTRASTVIKEHYEKWESSDFRSAGEGMEISAVIPELLGESTQGAEGQ
jgi:hypothetical protein